MYFSKPGKANTQTTVDLALRVARERGIGQILVASVSGETAQLLAGQLDGFPGRVVCLTHAYGFSEPGRNEMDAETRAQLQAAGMRVYTGTHVLSGVERGISNQAKGMYPAEIISNTLRMLGQGLKVCVEIAVMAVDAGLVPHGEKLVAIGGTGRGADTAAIITPAHANQIFNLRINEIICQPN